jgi:hypothetical protein
MMTDKLNKRSDYLTNDLKVYAREGGKGKGLRQVVKAQLHWWDRKQEGIEIIHQPILYKDL